MRVISVGRSGQELGHYHLDGLQEGLASGYFLPDDWGWYEGLPEWLPLSEIVSRLAEQSVRDQPPASPIAPSSPRSSAKRPRLALIAILFLLAILGFGTWLFFFPKRATVPPASVVSFNYDKMISGVNGQETILKPENVRLATFGQLFDDPIDGQAYAQPLYLPGVAIPNRGLHNVVYAATCHDSVYAFDADTGGDPLWKTSFISPAVGPGISAVPQPDVLSGDIQPEIGIVGTPVIDPATGTLYVVAKTKETGRGDHHTHYVQKLHALDVTTGAEKWGGPQVIGDVTCDNPGGDHNAKDFDYNLAANPQTPQVKGTSSNALNGVVYFNALRANQRPSLTLSGGVLYVGWSSHGDNSPYNGWLIGFDPKTLLPIPNRVFCTTPDGTEGGIWQSGCGPAVDADGNLYASTGNGDFNGDTAGRNWSQTFMKFFTSRGLTVENRAAGPDQTFDYFAPYNEKAMSDGDVDIGCGGLILFDVPGNSVPHLAIGVGKIGLLYVMNRDDLGKFDPKKDHVVQEVEKQGFCEIFSTPIFFNNTLFYNRNGEELRARAFSHGQFADAYNRTSIRFDARGGGANISANGTKDGVLWILDNSQPASLQAYNADVLAASNTGRKISPIYQEALPDGGVKFTHPVIANGKVYAVCATRNGDQISSAHLCVFGLLPTTDGRAKPLAPIRLGGRSPSPEKVELTWANHDPGVSGFRVMRRQGDSDAQTQVGTVGGTTTTFQDRSVSGQTTYHYTVMAVSTGGTSDPSESVTVRSHDYISKDGLVAAWSFDEGIGSTTLDLTGHDHAGQLKGEVSWSRGLRNSGGLEFHGTGNAVSHVEVQDRADLDFSAQQSFSLVAWARPSSLPGHWAGLLAKSREAASAWYGLYISPDNHWTFRGPDDSKNVTGGAVTPDTWQQVVAVQDAKTQTRTLYVNGTQVASGAALQPADATGPLWIGQGNADEEGFAGGLDEIRIYNRALSPDDIAKLFAAPLPFSN
jgi:hypothetical protein